MATPTEATHGVEIESQGGQPPTLDLYNVIGAATITVLGVDASGSTFIRANVTSDGTAKSLLGLLLVQSAEFAKARGLIVWVNATVHFSTSGSSANGNRPINSGTSPIAPLPIVGDPLRWTKENAAGEPNLYKLGWVAA